MKTKKIAVLAMCVALAMILSYVESLIPSPGIPGVKLGLANIVLLFGHAASFFYSVSGAVLSLVGMILLKRTDKLGCVAVSVIGGVLHNAGQILTAWLLMGPNVVYYLPVLILSGTAAGVAVGAVSALMVRRVDLKL